MAGIRRTFSNCCVGDPLLVLWGYWGILPRTWTADGLYRVGYFVLFQRLAVGTPNIRECYAPQFLSSGIRIALCNDFS